MNNDNNLQSILQRYNEKHHPYNIVDAVTTKKSKSKPKPKPKPKRQSSKQHLLKERLAELNKYILTWRNLNIVTTEAERESVLNEIEQIKKELR